MTKDGTSRPTASSESTGARRWASRAAPSADGTSATIATTPNQSTALIRPGSAAAWATVPVESVAWK